MKKVLALFFVFFIILSTLCAYGDDVITVVVNDVKIEPKNAKGEIVNPFILDGSTYLPVRAVAESLNQNVEYDDATKSVFIGSKPNGEVKKNDEITIYINGSLLIPKDANGNIISPVVMDGTTYLPIRAVAEAFSKEVTWDGETKTVYISDYKDIFEGKYYKILKKGTNLALTVEGGSKENNAKLVFSEYTGDKSQIFCITHIKDGYYTIINMASGKAVDVPAESKEPKVELIIYTRNGNRNQQWFFKKTGSSYKIISNISSLFLDANDTYVKQDIESENSQLFDVEFVSEPYLKEVLTSEGFNLLSENEKRAFRAYLFTDIDFSKRVAAQAESLIASSDYFSLDKEGQAEVLRNCMKITPYYMPSGNVNLSHKSDYTIEGPYEVEKYYRWGGKWEPGFGYTITFDGGKHKITMYCPEDNENAKYIAKNVAESLSNFPYEFRKFVTTVYYDPVNDNTYNGSKHDLWMRINYLPSVEGSTQTFAHELGHVMDYNTDRGNEWYEAIAADIVPVSGYGNTNRNEDLAEFSRLFFISYDKPDLHKAIQIVYPNRYKAFINMLHLVDPALVEFTEKLPKLE